MNVLVTIFAFVSSIVLCLATTNGTNSSATATMPPSWSTNATSSSSPRQPRRLQGDCRRCISFYAHADTNYDKEERERFPLQVKRIPNDGDFIVHLGDLKGTDECKSEKPYSLVADAYLQHANVPVFVVPGDNDWYDCGGKLARQRGWNFFEKHFLHFYSRSGNELSWTVDHQATRAENFAFYRKRILFLGVHIVGGDIKNEKEWNDRLKDNLRWTKVSLEKYSRANVVVIFAHAAPTNKHQYFFDGLSKIANKNKRIDFLYLHGDHHRWKVDRPFDAKNIKRIMLDQGAIADPTHIQVCSCSNTQTFEFTQRSLSKK